MNVSTVMSSGGPNSNEQKPWPLAIKIGFRVCFCYMMLYTFFNGDLSPLSVLDGAPLNRGFIGKTLFFPFARLAVFVGNRIFHLSGVDDTWHASSSGDTALSWVLIFSFLAISLLATFIWSVLDRRRKNYDTLHVWLRFAIRLMLGVSMISYGLLKVFPFQMLPIPPGQLNEPLGQLTPMTLLWSLIGMSPLYQIICGTAELVSGILILIRRTALAGALLTVFVMSNVLLYNVFFDVPVKIFAAHLVLFASFLILPDASALWRFFVLHTPAVTAGVWVPQASRKSLQRATPTFEVVFLLATLVVFTIYWHGRWAMYKATLAPTPIFGVWMVKQSGPRTINSPDASPWTAIFIDNTYRALVRDSNGRLWRSGLRYNAKGTLDIYGPTEAVSFVWKEIDHDHLSLTTTRITQSAPLYASHDELSKSTATSFKEGQREVLLLERQAVPSSYPLLSREFHFVSEWPYER